MSVDLSLIFPNECNDIQDNALALKVFNATIQKVVDYFGGRESFVQDITIQNSESHNLPEDWEPLTDIEYSFSIPLLNVTCNMRQGYWDIWPNARYSHYFYPTSIDANGKVSLWVRENAFDVARVLGYSEAWFCDEYHSWNSLLDEDPEVSFDKWCRYGIDEKDARVYEFSLNMFEEPLKPHRNYESKYHDNLSECHALFSTFQLRCPAYQLLTLQAPTEKFVLASKDGDLHILNIENGEPLLPFPIDACDAKFNGAAGFTITRGKQSALFSYDGLQLIDFREGNFTWGWGEKNSCEVVITDLVTGRKFLRDGTEVLR